MASKGLSSPPKKGQKGASERHHRVLLIVCYAPITAVENGTILPYVATAVNGWHMVVVGDGVRWVSGEYSRIE